MPERPPSSSSYLQGHKKALQDLLRTFGQTPRDLTLGEQASIIPTRYHVTAPQNAVRREIVQQLNAAGFTVAGKRCT